MIGEYLTEEIEITRIRYEYFYNGILTFDIRFCNYDCLFCFSKEYRYNVEKNIKNKSIYEIHLNNLSYNSINKRVITLGENAEEDKKYINLNFGNGLNNNNLILGKNIFGKCVIKSNITTFIKQLQEFFLKVYPNTTQFRFTGGEITHKNFLPWFNEMISIYYRNNNGSLNCIIETNGSKFDINSKDPSFLIFLSLITEERLKKKLHIRISLKNPTGVFYEVLTKMGKKKNLENAINFGIYCYKEKINFHYTFLANYLSIDDLINFKRKILTKLESNGFKEYKERIDIFFKIFRNIEFERLFHYPILFKEYFVADILLEKHKIKDDKVEILKRDGNFLNILNKMKEIYNNRQTFSNKHKAYYSRFYIRSLPSFKEEVDHNIFYNDIIQDKRINSLFNISFNRKTDFKSRVNRLLNNTIKTFQKYEGIQEFWELAFRSQYLIEHIREDLLGSELHFKNISIVDRIPLYPGIFYLRDFWNQAHPNLFIYTLYSERKFIIDEKNSYAVFGINSNPKSHAHTDISRAIPFLIDYKSFPEIFKILVENHVTFWKSLKLRVINITNYTITFNRFKIVVPFFILKLEEFGERKDNFTPFLGNIGGLYDNYFIEERTKELLYLNYFIWTGIGGDITVNMSILKAFDYLLNKYEVLKIKENGYEEEVRWLQMKYIEPKEEILLKMGLLEKYKVLDSLDASKMRNFLHETSKNIDDKIRILVKED